MNSPAIVVVDNTFVGGPATTLAVGMPLTDALCWGCVAARLDAQAALTIRDEMQQLLHA